ncbi:MAG TPA: DNA-directed RNA polymerase subunit beta [Exilispira sp.]|nr:DNA-directed RNA polymerase subunit beta [Exilispira sp.]
MKVKFSPIKNNPNRFYINGKKDEIIDFPNFLEIQKISYEWFLQLEKKLNKLPIETQGLEDLFKSHFPIESKNNNIVLEYVEYYFGQPKYTVDEARTKGKTYSIPIKILVNLIFKDSGEVRSKEIYFGDFPLLTDAGTFIINGAERVVVSQIHRSPGVMFKYDDRNNEYQARLSPDKGAWLEFILDEKKEILSVRIDKKRKIPATTFLRVLGLETNEKIIDAFYETEILPITYDLTGRISAQTLIIETDFCPERIIGAGQEIRELDIDKMMENEIRELKVINLKSSKKVSTQIILNTIQKEAFEKDPDNPLKSEPSKEEAINKVFNILRPGEPALIETAEIEIKEMFFNPHRYFLGKVGRFKLNRKFGYKENVTDMNLLMDDIINTVIYLTKIAEGIYNVDDEDHLSNRRIRAVGELIYNELKKGFSRMQKIAIEKMNTIDPETANPTELVNNKPITSVLNEFFGTSQLSQFMDQTNPLTELTHKRRINALGKGGLSRDRAGSKVRDVHTSHYGRLCPIETPEGQNIGLILSLTTFSKPNDFGYLETPYIKVENGVITNKVEFLTAIEEERYYIAQATEPRDENGNFINEFIDSRHNGEYISVHKSKIDYIDLSPRQLISISTALIPFLEHNDANRALMGSNMQRQAIPLLYPQSPYVGTGIEQRVVKDAGIIHYAKRSGKVIEISNSTIVIEPDHKTNNKDLDRYNLVKYFRTNQDTVYNQRPIVKLGQKVKEGQPLTDGPSAADGELALGVNLKVAFIPWYGYNFEDAIVISERVVKEDLLTSLHIKEFQIEVRDTKLGPEKITRDIPNCSERDLKDLDENGIIKIGSYVTSNSILVGKVTPKGHEELFPEYKLFKSIFGEKASEVRDTSLRVPHGVEGYVTEVIKLNKNDVDDLDNGVEEIIKVYVATKRKIQVGDKLSGRHGNKGVISIILPEEDMPFLPDGTPVDIVLNPLGVPSRMNLGQIFETSLGWVCEKINKKVAVPVFESPKYEEIQKMLEEVGLPSTSKTNLYDGKTGEKFINDVLVGNIYILKLNHMVEDKVHARSTGNYSLVTQQPLGGKAQFGGQRLGEMEVWALEAYGAAATLHEFLTQKSDDRTGRNNMYHAIVKEEPIPPAGIPEAFNVLIQELRGMCLHVILYDENEKEISLTEKEQEKNVYKSKQML